VTDRISIGASMSGIAAIYCVHDREKRNQLTTEEFDPRVYDPEVCVCCENIYLQRKGDFEKHGLPLCDTCRGDPVHSLGGPLKGE
jgi:hypothetical protein